MINYYNVNQYCCDDISLIENYDKAINDDSQSWHCHHKLETELNMSPKDLKEIGRYFNVPASELIFLTKSEHTKIHNKKLSEERRKNISISQRSYYKTHSIWNKGLKGVQESPMKGKHQTKESNEKNRLAHLGKYQSEETRKKRSESMKKYWAQKREQVN